MEVHFILTVFGTDLNLSDKKMKQARMFQLKQFFSLAVTQHCIVLAQLSPSLSFFLFHHILLLRFWHLSSYQPNQKNMKNNCCCSTHAPTQAVVSKYVTTNRPSDSYGFCSRQSQTNVISTLNFCKDNIGLINLFILNMREGIQDKSFGLFKLNTKVPRLVIYL